MLVKHKHLFKCEIYATNYQANSEIMSLVESQWEFDLIDTNGFDSSVKFLSYLTYSCV